MTFQNKRLLGIVIGTALLLMIPLVAMQFTSEVNWDGFDFLIMGILLLCTGLSCEFVLRKVKKLEHRLVLCGFLLVGLFLVWAELAVGIFGTTFAGS